MQRFLVNKECIARDIVILEGDIVHQIRDVLRLQSGERIVLFDNSGLEYTVALDKVDRKQVTGAVCDTRNVVEPDITITLYQALLKLNHFEFVLQKCTEIGVSVFVPTTCERCVVRKPGANKIQRWERIIREATEQSGRSVTPILKSTLSFKDACRSVKGLSLIADARPTALELSRILKSKLTGNSISTINVFIGPEGGFAPEELELAQRYNLQPVSLGPRVLRAETAGLVAAAAILYQTGELDRPPMDIKL